MGTEISKTGRQGQKSETRGTNGGRSEMGQKWDGGESEKGIRGVTEKGQSRVELLEIHQ